MSVRFIDDATVRSHLTPLLAYQSAVDTLRDQRADGVRLSTPRALFLEVDPETRLQAKAAALTHAGIGGVRLAGERSHRYVDQGRIIVLYDLTSLLPVAVIAEQSIYQARVAAQVLIATSRLRNAGDYTVAMIGSGRLATATMRSILLLDPPNSVRIASRRAASAELTADQLSKLHPDTPVRAAPDIESACFGADVIVTLTNATTPIVEGEWCSPGSVVVSAGGGWECAASVYEQADILVVDDWDQCRLFGDIAHVEPLGVVSASSVAATLADIVEASACPRQRHEDRIVAVTQGSTALDVALANAVRTQLTEQS